MTGFTTFLHDWQDLAGAFLGSSLAIILSGIGYLIGRYIENVRERRETLRRIEVGTTYSLSSTHSIHKKLENFVRTARALVTEIRAINNPREFALQSVNFPTVGTIYLDEKIPELRVNSYYLHNKLLWIHAGTQDVNGILAGMGTHFMRVIKLNEMMLDLMADNPNPPAQRAAYAENIEIFANEIERFYREELPKGIKVLVQVKVYNEKLRQPFGRGRVNLWEYEGLSFKYFRNRKEYKKFARNLDSIDRIDAAIQADVDKTQATMQQRAEQLAGEEH